MLYNWKQCGNRRRYSLRAMFPFAIIFSIVDCSRCVELRFHVGKGQSIVLAIFLYLHFTVTFIRHEQRNQIKQVSHLEPLLFTESQIESACQQVIAPSVYRAFAPLSHQYYLIWYSQFVQQDFCLDYLLGVCCLRLVYPCHTEKDVCT